MFSYSAATTWGLGDQHDGGFRRAFHRLLHWAASRDVEREIYGTGCGKDFSTLSRPMSTQVWKVQDKGRILQERHSSVQHEGRTPGCTGKVATFLSVKGLIPFTNQNVLPYRTQGSWPVWGPKCSPMSRRRSLPKSLPQSRPRRHPGRQSRIPLWRGPTRRPLSFSTTIKGLWTLWL